MKIEIYASLKGNDHFLKSVACVWFLQPVPFWKSRTVYQAVVRNLTQEKRITLPENLVFFLLFLFFLKAKD